MNTLGISFGYGFLRKNILFDKISWYDIYYGIVNGFIDSESITEYATEILSFTENEMNEEMLEMASLYPQEAHIAMIEHLVKNVDDIEKKFTREKYMFLSLLYILTNIKSFSDITQILSIIYDDFGFDKKMSSLIYDVPGQTHVSVSEKKNILEKYPELKKIHKGKRAVYIEWINFLENERMRINN